jgi:hypothetical protein
VSHALEKTTEYKIFRCDLGKTLRFGTWDFLEKTLSRKHHFYFSDITHTKMTGCGEGMRDLFTNRPPSYPISAEDGLDRLHEKTEVSKRLTSTMHRLDRVAALQLQVEAASRINDAAHKGQVEITGLELLLQDGCSFNEDIDDCRYLINEDDYADDCSISFESISQRSLEDHYHSMQSIANDSIDITRMRQQHRKSQCQLNLSSSLGQSISFEGAPSFAIEASFSDAKGANDSAESFTSTSYQSFATELFGADTVERASINTGGANRAA